MEISIDQYNKIQQYLNNKMSISEEASFERELQTNAVLKDYYLFEIDLNDVLETHKFKESYPHLDVNLPLEKKNNPEIKNKIATLGKEWKKEKERISVLTIAPNVTNTTGYKKTRTILISLKGWISIAAAACLVSIIVYIFWVSSKDANEKNFAANKIDSSSINNTQSGLAKNNRENSIKNKTNNEPLTDTKDIGNKYYKKDNLPDAPPDKLIASLYDYKKNDYKSIEEFDFQKLNQEKDVNSENLKSDTYKSDQENNHLRLHDRNSEENIKELGHYYKGLAFIETENYSDAKNNLQWIIDSAANNNLILKSKWYTALLFLKQNNKTDAIPLLQEVSNNKELLYTSYSKKAKAILKDLGE